jgi:hypothetical protein
MVKRGGLEEMCHLLVLVAREEEARLANAPELPGLAPADADAPDLGSGPRAGAPGAAAHPPCPALAGPEPAGARQRCGLVRAPTLHAARHLQTGQP